MRFLQTIFGTLPAVTAGPEVLSETLAQALSRLLDAPIAGLILIRTNGEPATFWSTTEWPNNSETVSRFIREDLICTALKKRSPVVVRNLHQDISFAYLGHPTEIPIVLSVCVPLAQEGNPAGGLVAFFGEERSFGRCELRILQIVANLAATLLRISTAYVGEKQRANRFNQLVADERQVFERFQVVYKELTNAALDGGGVQGIAEALSRLIFNPLLVDDRFGEFVVQASPVVDEAGDTLREKVRHYPLSADFWRAKRRKNGAKQLRTTRDLTYLPPDPGAGMPVSRVTAPVFAGEDYLGSITVLQSNRELSEVDLRAVEHAARVIALEMMKQRAVLEVEQRMKGDFLREFLTSSQSDMGDVSERARCLGYNLAAVERVMIVGVDKTSLSGNLGKLKNAQVGSQNRGLLEFAQRLAVGKAYASLIPDNGGSKVLLLVLRETLSNVERGSNALNLAKAIKGEIKAYLSGTTVSIGMGSPCSRLTDLRRSYREAQQCLRLLWSLEGQDQILCFDHLGVMRLLLTEGSSTILAEYAERLLDPVIEYDRRHRSELLRTLEIYLKYDCCVSTAAGALFVHPSTLKYRLSKIEYLCSVNIHDGETKLNLQIAVRILRLKASIGGPSSPFTSGVEQVSVACLDLHTTDWPV